MVLKQNQPILKKMTKTQDPHEETMWNCSNCEYKKKKKDM